MVSVSSELEKSAKRFGLILRPLRLTTSLGDSSPCESKAASCFDASLVAFPLPRFFFTSGVSYHHVLFLSICLIFLKIYVINNIVRNNRTNYLIFKNICRQFLNFFWSIFINNCFFTQYCKACIEYSKAFLPFLYKH